MLEHEGIGSSGIPEPQDLAEELLRQRAFEKSPTFEKFLAPMEAPVPWHTDIFDAANDHLHKMIEAVGEAHVVMMGDYIMEGANTRGVFTHDPRIKELRGYYVVVTNMLMTVGWDLQGDAELLGFAERKLTKKVRKLSGFTSEHGTKGRTREYVHDGLLAGQIVRETANGERSNIFEEARQGIRTLDGKIYSSEPTPDIFFNAFGVDFEWPIFDDNNKPVTPDQGQSQNGEYHAA